ncbi:hypothetical protein QE152_g13053 [Popillia japonica]|uniref:Uncharacterized protein n=1 Tax=Popillia japonica TaxID=7064 RepID=A0AAW1LH40_POPJA
MAIQKYLKKNLHLTGDERRPLGDIKRQNNIILKIANRTANGERGRGDELPVLHLKISLFRRHIGLVSSFEELHDCNNMRDNALNMYIVKENVPAGYSNSFQPSNPVSDCRRSPKQQSRRQFCHLEVIEKIYCPSEQFLNCQIG